MKDLRPLLIDCRIELRKHQRDFQKSELCERLDLFLQSLNDSAVNITGTAPAVSASAAAAANTTGTAPAVGSEKSQTASQVALAWQTAARDLKFTEPATYQRLSEKVMRLLGSKTLVDPATEILQLQAEAETLRQRADSDSENLHKLQFERDTLLEALAEAVPDLTGGPDRLAMGLAQIEHLRRHGAPQTTATSGGNGKPEPMRESHIPTAEILGAVVGGLRGFTDDQRNWAVGEGMVLSGFQYTPVELVQMGDQALAKLIVEKQAG